MSSLAETDPHDHPSGSSGTTSPIPPTSTSDTSDSATSLLHLPAEIVSEIAEYIKHPLDTSDWYYGERFMDWHCCEIEEEEGPYMRWRSPSPDMYRSREDILAFATSCKAIRQIIMVPLLREIGFNICGNQFSKLCVVSKAIRDNVCSVVINKDPRVHDYEDDQLISFIDFMRPFVNIQTAELTFTPLRMDFDDQLLLGLEAAAVQDDERKRNRQPTGSVPFPSLRHLCIKILAPPPVDWYDNEDIEKLGQLECVLRQVDLSMVEVFVLRLEEMWDFHKNDASWRCLEETLRFAQFPRLQHFTLELQLDQDEQEFTMDIHTHLHSLLCSYRPSDSLRRLKVSVNLLLTFGQAHQWLVHRSESEELEREREDGAAEEQEQDPKLVPAVLPTFEDLTKLLEAVKKSHPQLDYLWLDLSCTFNYSLPTRDLVHLKFWQFRYPLATDEDGNLCGDDADLSRAETDVSTARTEDGRFARFAVYNDNIRQSADE